jgi:hypothetical protein
VAKKVPTYVEHPVRSRIALRLHQNYAAPQHWFIACIYIQNYRNRKFAPRVEWYLPETVSPRVMSASALSASSVATDADRHPCWGREGRLGYRQVVPVAGRNRSLKDGYQRGMIQAPPPLQMCSLMDTLHHRNITAIGVTTIIILATIFFYTI